MKLCRRDRLQENKIRVQYLHPRQGIQPLGYQSVNIDNLGVDQIRRAMTVPTMWPDATAKEADSVREAFRELVLIGFELIRSKPGVPMVGVGAVLLVPRLPFRRYPHYCLLPRSFPRYLVPLNSTTQISNVDLTFDDEDAQEVFARLLKKVTTTCHWANSNQPIEKQKIRWLGFPLVRSVSTWNSNYDYPLDEVQDLDKPLVRRRFGGNTFR